MGKLTKKEIAIIAFNNSCFHHSLGWCERTVSIIKGKKMERELCIDCDCKIRDRFIYNYEKIVKYENKAIKKA